MDVGSDRVLSATLKRWLSGQRYLIVMDDIWDSKDWNDLMLCFPDDNVGSRIVFTTRLADVPLQVQPDCYQHPLRFLNEKESWDLLQYKVFLNDSCPSSLVEIGKQIAKKCHGLPLSVVVIAGILANDTTTHWWSRVAQDMNSIGSTAPEQYMDTLILSYNHLPDHLKPCFLYFAAFSEDYEIPAWKLILLWVAEGFIKIQTDEHNLEDVGINLEEVAVCYLKDLITRSLVIVSKSKSNGGIKSCIVHDALHDLCIKKADEMNFLHQMPTLSKVETTATGLVQRFFFGKFVGENFIRHLIRYFHLETQSAPMVDTTSTNRYSNIIPRAVKWIKYIFMFKKSLNLNVHTNLAKKENVQTILAYSGLGTYFSADVSTDFYLFEVLRAFKFLKVIDLSSVGLDSIPSVFETLLELRYIALCIEGFGDYSLSNMMLPEMPMSICRLKHLETFIVHSKKLHSTDLPNGILKLNRLRHLILKGYFDNRPPLDNLQTLSHLQTFSLPLSLADTEKVLQITPNLRKLSINHALYRFSSTLTISNLSKLQHLESLILKNRLRWGSSGELAYRELSSPSMFPVTLRNLRLVRTFLKWDEMQKIGVRKWKV